MNVFANTFLEGDFLKKIAVINDLSGFGRCSLTASLPIISVMGHEAVPMPTAILSNQTGYENCYCDDFTDRMGFFTENWKNITSHFDGIFTGYIANEKQIDIISHFINDFRNEDTLVLCDPVMADDGKMYSKYSESMCKKIILLAHKANVITPNFTELCILSNESFDEISVLPIDKLLEKVKMMSQSLLNDNLKTVITTGIPSNQADGDFIATAVLWDGGFNSLSVPKIGGSFSGTGDIFASIICSSMLNNVNPLFATIKAVGFISKAIEETVKHPYDRNDGIDFQKFLKEL